MSRPDPAAPRRARAPGPSRLFGSGARRDSVDRAPHHSHAIGVWWSDQPVSADRNIQVATASIRTTPPSANTRPPTASSVRNRTAEARSPTRSGTNGTQTKIEGRGGITSSKSGDGRRPDRPRCLCRQVAAHPRANATRLAASCKRSRTSTSTGPPVGPDLLEFGRGRLRSSRGNRRERPSTRRGAQARAASRSIAGRSTRRGSVSSARRQWDWPVSSPAPINSPLRTPLPAGAAPRGRIGT